MTLPTAELLSQWQGKLAIITRNANDLFEADYTKRIRNRLRDGRYSGLTRERAGEAIDRLTALMDDYLVLARVIDAAASVSKAGFFETRDWRDEREQRMLDLLEGHSVELPAIHVPLPQRDLLTDSSQAQKVTPAELLHAMQAAFAQARDHLSSIDHAEAAMLGESEKLRAEYCVLMQQADMLGAGAARPPFRDPSSDVTDPLQTQSAINATAWELASWKRQLDTLEAERYKASSMLESNAQGISQLAQLHQSLQQLIGESRALFGEIDSTVAETAANEIDDFNQWLGKLRITQEQRRWRAVRTGGANLETAVRSVLDRLQAQRQQLRDKLDEIAELKGRFKALRIKANTLSRIVAARGVALNELETEIAGGFKLRPIPLDTQRLRISRYETELLEASSSHSAP